VPGRRPESTVFEITNERNTDLDPVILSKEDTPPSVEKKNRHSYHDPYVRQDDVEKREEIRKSLREIETRRMQDEPTTVVPNPSRMHNAEWIQEMTSTPAFARRKIQLDDVAPSSDLKMSRLTVTDDEGDEVLGKNTYLYDKPC